MYIVRDGREICRGITLRFNSEKIICSWIISIMVREVELKFQMRNIILLFLNIYIIIWVVDQELYQCCGSNC